jgi:hypothetical protein
MDILNVTIFMTKELHLSDFAAEMLMAPFDYVVVCVLFHPGDRITRLLAFFIWRYMTNFFIHKLVRLMTNRLLMLRSPGFSFGFSCWIFLSALILALKTFRVVRNIFSIFSLFLLCGSRVRSIEDNLRLQQMIIFSQLDNFILQHCSLSLLLR